MIMTFANSASEVKPRTIFPTRVDFVLMSWLEMAPQLNLPTDKDLLTLINQQFEPGAIPILVTSASVANDG